MSRYFSAYCLLCLLLVLTSCSDSTEVIIPRSSPPPLNLCPKWAPDSVRIVYYHEGIDRIYDDGSYSVNHDSVGLWMVNSDGTNNHLLFSTGSSTLDWSPDGIWIAYTSYGRVYKAKVEAATIDTASIQALTADVDGLCCFPSWSSDGVWIAYDCAPENHDALWKVKADGSEKVKIRDYARDPDFAPRGNRILYLKSLQGEIGSQIYSMDLSTSDEVRLTYLDEYVNDPDYSPDAGRVVFSDLNICVINSDGTGLVRISGFEGVFPSWSSSGREILFVKTNRTNWNNHGIVCIMSDDGTGLRTLIRGVE